MHPKDACSVLLVEDEFFIAFDLADALVEAGVKVIGPARTLAEARALLEAGEEPDLAVLDIGVAGELVYPLAAELRRRGAQVLLASGYDHDAVPSEFRNAPFWPKPFDPRAMAQAVSRFGATARS
jgi:DNA-binding response OmpR family regulator